MVRDRSPEETPVPSAASAEKVDGRDEGGNRLRAASEAVALVSAGVLVGGGAGMLAGFALGAINPFALGLIGAAAGACVPVLRKAATGARRGRGGPWWRRVFGG